MISLSTDLKKITIDANPGQKIDILSKDLPGFITALSKFS